MPAVRIASKLRPKNGNNIAVLNIQIAAALGLRDPAVSQARNMYRQPLEAASANTISAVTSTHTLEMRCATTRLVSVGCAPS